MALVLRTVVGRPLTWTEGDDNLTYLEQLAPAPGGASGELQYNDNGIFSGVATLVYTNSTLQATGSFKGDLDGTAASASYVLNAESASYALSAITASFVTGSDVNGAVSEALHATLADTASYIGLSGLGITVNNLELTASVRSVNGILPVNGNIQTSLSATKTGTSASFDSSGSGAITGSIPDGLVWIISGDPTPAWNGDTYIYNSGSVGAWYPIATLDIATTDALYLRLNTANGPMTGNLNMGNNNITNVNIVSASTFNGTIASANVSGPFGANSILSSSYAVSASWAPATPAFPYTGDATISGSLTVTGSIVIPQGVARLQSYNNLIGSGTILNVGTYNDQTTPSVLINSGDVNANDVSTAALTLSNYYKDAGQLNIAFTYRTNQGIQTKGKIRVDHAGSMTYTAYDDYVRFGGTGSHYFNVGGEGGVGTLALQISSDAVGVKTNLNVTGSTTLSGLNVIGTATLTSASVVGDMITNVGDTFATPAVIKIVSLTSGEYTSLSPNYDANTLYVVI